MSVVGPSIQRDVVIGQDHTRPWNVAFQHHDTTWQNAYRSFQNAHVYVHFKAVYTLALKQGHRMRNDNWIIGAYEFLHSFDVNLVALFVEGLTER